MKTQKQSRADQLEKKLEAQTRILQFLLGEVGNLKTLAFGTMETIKLMPGYNDAIEKLKEIELVENTANFIEKEFENE
jgi:hypothetical protein